MFEILGKTGQGYAGQGVVIQVKVTTTIFCLCCDFKLTRTLDADIAWLQSLTLCPVLFQWYHNYYTMTNLQIEA